MPPFQGSELFRDQNSIVAGFLSAIQAIVPDVWVGEDGNLRMLFEIEAGQIEGLYLANQLLLEDVFVPSASLGALQRHGDQYGVERKLGTSATGQLLFTGEGGTYIPIGAEVAFDPGGGGDVLYYSTTADGTIPNPGVPSAPVATDAGAGVLSAGTYEWVVTFLTSQGETTPSAASNALILAASHQATITLPLGGPGTTGRNLYRNINGGAFQLVSTINNNTATTTNDNNNAPGVQVPPTTDNSERIQLAGESEDTGLDYNAVPGAIRVLVAVPDGITDVTNPTAFIGGTDQEDIDVYRDRVLGTLRNPGSGAPGDLEAWAEAIDGVESATVFSNDNLGVSTPGHTTIRISGPGGSVPNSTVINAVASAIAAQDLANITIHVATFTQTPINVTVVITPMANYVAADLAPGVIAAIDNYIASVPVGGTLYVSGIIQYAREVTGVADIVVSTPTTNQVAAATSKFIPGTITAS